MMFEKGRVCVKLAGRDAGKKCIITKILDAPYVEIDGETRRRKCNVGHLEPLAKVLTLPEEFSQEDLHKLFEEQGWDITTSKPRSSSSKPKKKRAESVKK